jgi:hypothetical protein
MKVLSPILVVFVSVLACSSTRMSTLDGGWDGMGGSDAHGSDAATIAADGSDAGTIDAADSDSGTGVPDAHRQPLCDGVQHLRLWVLLRPGGSELRGSAVRVENGYGLLAIDGTCSYWIGGGWTEDAFSRDLPFRTGKVSDADVRAIEAGLPIDDVTSLRDCPPPPAGLFDYSVRDIRSEVATAACVGSAPELTAGTRFEAAWMTVEAVATRLWTDGTPMDGPLHVSAVEASGGASRPAPYAWPIAAPLGSFLLDSSDWFRIGVSRLVDDPDSARQLRALRDRYLADRTAQPGLFVSWDGLEVTDQSGTALVYMRDAIPYEDAQGLLKF